MDWRLAARTGGILTPAYQRIQAFGDQIPGGVFGTKF